MTTAVLASVKRRALLVLAAVSASAVVGQGIASAASREPQPGEGVLCMWVFTAAAAEIGRRCRAGERPELQAELDHVVERFEAYVLANDPGATPETVARFKRAQGIDGAAGSAICQSELASLPDRIDELGLAHWRSQVDEVLARPGRPTFGDCV